ncbi:protein of unknown function (plasmid) [Agrobacterium pusense]|uniref:Uncharacterized protein n=1 Tax=Agrobacterium pusense TaxID=648995 RepID=U4Q6V6_9HYPH|nr:protein of unknown function [Agrobacterium pusense]
MISLYVVLSFIPLHSFLTRHSHRAATFILDRHRSPLSGFRPLRRINKEIAYSAPASFFQGYSLAPIDRPLAFLKKLRTYIVLRGTLLMVSRTGRDW